MQVLVIVLNDLSYQQKVLEIFIENNVRGATILDSEGMAKAVLENEGLGMLLGGPFAKSIPTNPASSKTLFTVIPDDSIIPKLIEQLKNTLEGSDKRTVGFMFTLPVSGIYPLTSKRKKELK